MHWIAWSAPPDDAAPGMPAAVAGWWALRFTPRVAWLDEALLAEVSATERLWGGHDALRVLLRRHHPAAQGDAPQPLWAEGATALQALALLRLSAAGLPRPRHVPHDLPLHALSALRPHAASLERMGCRTWGALRALPRAGVARRFGAAPLAALEQAWGDAPHQLPWLELPERFAMEADLPALAETADALLWSAARLLAALHAWLRARHQGVLALELSWRHDLRRLDGVELPPWQHLRVRTAEPTQDLAHLRRLLAEHLARQRLAAPVGRIALAAPETAPLARASASLLPPGPDDPGPGEPWHQFAERLSARLGADRVRLPVLHADHRPERMQHWQPAAAAGAVQGGTQADAAGPPEARLWPAWLLRPPRPLALQGHRPCLQGPLRLLAGPHRFEAGWWYAREEGAQAGAGEALALRDYFVAHNAVVGTVWVFRERGGASGQARWYLHGIYG